MLCRREADRAQVLLAVGARHGATIHGIHATTDRAPCNWWGVIGRLRAYAAPLHLALRLLLAVESECHMEVGIGTTTPIDTERAGHSLFVVERWIGNAGSVEALQ